MTRQWTLNLGLLLLVATLIGIALLRPGIEKQPAHVPLTTIESGQVNKIVIERPGYKTIVLEKQEQGWRMTSPITARASESVINNVLAATSAPSLKQIPYAKESDSDKYGFSKPRVTLRLDQAEIVFGDTSPLNQQQYVLVDNTVHMVSGNVLWSIARNYDQYLDRRLIDRPDTPIAIEFADRTRLQLVNGSWRLQPENKTLDSDALTRLVNEWKFASALRIQPYIDAPLLGKIRIQYADRKTIEIGILSREPELVLVRRDQGLQYHLAAGSAKRLFPPTR